MKIMTPGLIVLKQKKTLSKNKCSVRNDRDETVNQIITKCINLAQKEYHKRLNLLWKVIHWEMCKIL